MLKILCKRGEIAPEEQFLLLSTIFCYLMLDLYVKRGIRFSLRDKRLFEITEVEITRVDCNKDSHIKCLRAHTMDTFHIMSRKFEKRNLRSVQRKLTERNN